MATVSEIHHQIVDAWNSRDWTAMRNLLHSDYSYTGPDGKELVGSDAGVNVGRMYANAFPDGKLEIKRVHVAGNTAIAELLATGTHRGDLMGVAPTGKRVELNICNVLEVRDGKALREREYMDVMTMMGQLGVVQGPAAKAATAK
jgi:steroid delta-isomerase-like uncharacterized protein